LPRATLRLHQSEAPLFTNVAYVVNRTISDIALETQRMSGMDGGLIFKVYSTTLNGSVTSHRNTIIRSCRDSDVRSEKRTNPTQVSLPL